MFRGGLPPGSFATDEQKYLVAGVDERVHALGEHRGRRRDGERDEFDQCYAQIGAQRGDHGSGPAAPAHNASSPGLGGEGSMPMPNARYAAVKSPKAEAAPNRTSGGPSGTSADDERSPRCDA